MLFLLNFKWEFVETWHACLLLYEDLYIIMTVWSNYSSRSYCPSSFWRPGWLNEL